MDSLANKRNFKVKQSNFEKLKVWQKAHELVLKIYKSTTTFPKEERFALVDIW